MAPIKTARYKHQWTPFEEHTLFCLMCRKLHITGMIDNKPSPRRAQKRNKANAQTSMRQAHMDVATELNKALNYDDTTRDIDYREVSAKIEQLQATKKSAVKFMERCNVGRVTRASRKVWERGVRFDGSIAEWQDGRKEEEQAFQADRAIRGFDAQDQNQGFSGVAAGWGDDEAVTATNQDQGQYTVGVSAGWGGDEVVTGRDSADVMEIDAWGGATQIALEEGSGEGNFGGGATQQATGEKLFPRGNQVEADVGWGGDQTTAATAQTIGGGNIGDEDTWGTDNGNTVVETPAPLDSWGGDESTLADALPANSHNFWEEATLVDDISGPHSPFDFHGLAGARASTPEPIPPHLGSPDMAEMSQSHFEDQESVHLDRTSPPAEEIEFSGGTTSLIFEDDLSDMEDNSARLLQPINTGINPARLALLETVMNFDETAVQEPRRGRTRTGNNALALPFNRLNQQKPKA